jgi:hypothetical protein
MVIRIDRKLDLYAKWRARLDGSNGIHVIYDAGEGTNQTTATFYYDQASTVGLSVANSLSDAKNKYAYETLTEFLSTYGIILNETYFELINFESANATEVNFKQAPFSAEVTCCVSIILMLGIAYLLARDNETQVSKNIAYVPVGLNRYLFSKTIPFFVIGMFEIALMYLLGMAFFDIHFQINVVLAILLSSFFVLAIIMLGLMFSLLKSQISTIFLDMLVVILPIFISIVVYVQASPLFVKIMLYCLPITPFINFLNCMMFNGVILWWNIPIFIAQSICYYLITLCILKKRVAA